MEAKGKIKNPIIMKLSHLGNVILPSNGVNETHPLEPGAVIGDEHYGFIVIVDKNNHQSHHIYLTDYPLEAVGIVENLDSKKELRIFEKNKNPWCFNLQGDLVVGQEPEISYTEQDTLLDNLEFFGVEEQVINPIVVRVKGDIYDNIETNSVIVNGESFPIYPGCLIGTTNYGFILEIETENGIKREVYPTANRIDGVCCKKSFCNDITIFEEGKYHPWKFTCTGDFISKSEYEKYSRKDREHFEENYTFTGTDDVKKLERKQ